MLKILFGGFLLLVIALLANLLAHPSRQLTVTAVEAERFDSGMLASQLAEGLRLRTISSRDPKQRDEQPFEDFQSLLAEQFPHMHQSLQREVIGQSLLFRWEGAAPDLSPILLMAHIDVVPVQAETAQRWKHSAYSGTVQDGYVWGRGALDNKGALYMIASAVERLVEQAYRPGREVWIAFGHDEEVGGKHGNAEIARRFAADGLRFAAVIDEGGSMVRGLMPGLDGPVAVIGIAEKGYLTIRLSVDGAGGHSSAPPLDTTVGILGRALARLQDAPFPYSLTEPVHHMLDFVGPELPMVQRLVMANRWLFGSVLESSFARQDKTRAMLHTTMAPTMLSAGIRENVLAKHAGATINFRLVPGDTLEKIVQQVTETIADDRVQVTALDGFAASPSPVSSPDSEIFLTLQRTIHELYPDAVVTPFLMMAATDSRHYIPVAENIYRFMPYQLDAKELGGIHGVNERISVESLARGAAFYHRLIMKLTQN